MSFFKVENQDGDEIEIQSPVFGFYVSGAKKMFVLSDHPPDELGMSYVFQTYIANPSDHDWKRNLYLIWFGSTFATNFLVWANGFEDALEEAAQAALDAGMKGFFVGDAELKELYDEAREELGPDADDSEVYEQAEADLTYTESGHIPSYEWGGQDVHHGQAFGDGQDLYTAAKFVCEAYTDDSGEERFELVPNRGRRHRKNSGANYSIDDGHGNQLTTGLQEHNVWKVAQDLANRRGESVYVYEGGDEEPTVVAPRRLHARNARGGALDEHAARELELFIENEYSLVGAPNSMGKAIEKNLERKIKSGKFDYELSIKGWGHLIEAGAKKYAQEFAEGRDWHQIFSPATRRYVAERFAKDFAQRHGVAAA